MSDIPFGTLVWSLALAARWTLALTAIAFLGGFIGGALVMLARMSRRKAVRAAATACIEFVQGTPLLMQLFCVYFGLPLLGFSVSAWLAAMVGLTLYASAYLGDIWRGCVAAIPKGQWDAGASLGLGPVKRFVLVILPQAGRIAIPPTVGFLVQLIKATALASIIGFTELARTGEILANATLQPFLVFGMVAAFYFALCFPLTRASEWLERRLDPSRRT